MPVGEEDSRRDKDQEQESAQAVAALFAEVSLDVEDVLPLHPGWPGTFGQSLVDEVVTLRVEDFNNRLERTVTDYGIVRDIQGGDTAQMVPKGTGDLQNGVL